MSAGSCSGCFISRPTPCYAPEKAVKEGPNAWLPEFIATLDEAPGSWFQSGPALEIMATLVMRQYVDDISVCDSLYNSAFQINQNK